MATLTVHTIPKAIGSGVEIEGGLEVINASPAIFTAIDPSGDQFLHTGKEHILVKANASPAGEVVVEAQATCSQGDSHDFKYGSAFVANDIVIYPLLDKNLYTDTNGYAQLSYPSGANLEVAIVQEAAS